MVKVLLYPIFTSQQPIFTVLNAANSSGKNEIKMIKRDWKLPNPSYFTYTSIVQPVLQVYNPFYKPRPYFYSFLVAFKGSKFEAGKMIQK